MVLELHGAGTVDGSQRRISITLPIVLPFLTGLLANSWHVSVKKRFGVSVASSKTSTFTLAVPSPKLQIAKQTALQ